MTSLSGALIAVAAWQILRLEFRYALAVIGGIVVLCAGLALIKRLDDYLIYILIFNVTFAQFGKWMLPQREDIVFARGISVGLAELIILMAYLSWYAKIFISRTESMPRFQKAEYLILLLILCQVMSMIGAPKKILSFLDIVYNIKHALIYFFIARKIKYGHLTGIILIFLFAIFLESSIGVYERYTGNVGIGNAKGSAEGLGTQFIVPGIEHVIRSEGTTADSHSLGLYFVMLLPVPLVFTAMRFLKTPYKVATGLVFIIGSIGLLVTFTRSGWICFALSSAFSLSVIIFLWRQSRAIIMLLAVLLGLSLFYPQGYQKIHQRFQSAPWELITERLDQSKTAFGVWKSHFFFGCGAANYMPYIENTDTPQYDTGELPAHVMVLLIAAEIGLFGVTAYYGIIFLAMFRCCQMLGCSDRLIRGVALALLTAFIGYLLDGLTSPLGRNVVPYYQLWVYIGISMSLKRVVEEKGTLSVKPINEEVTP